MIMKGKTKAEKGITLVALIITVVVLLILATVTISSIQEYGILEYATNAGDLYNQAQVNEQGTIGKYENYLKNNVGGEVEDDDGSTREGQTVKYDSNGDGTPEDWIVLTDREGLVEIVSASSMGSLKLGSKDSTVNVTTDLDGDGTVGDAEDKAIASYNNAITTINNYCKSLVKEELRDKVRSVGGTNNSFTPYHSTNYDNWGKDIKVDVASGDEQYKTDLERMQELGIAATGERYWLASRNVGGTSGRVFFSVRSVDTAGDLYNSYLWDVNSAGNVHNGYYPSYAVRLVITNPDI